MIIVERDHSFFIASAAALVADDMEVAWAEPLIRRDPHLRWMVGRYVEADRPNKNGHIFPLDDLRAKVLTIPDKPLNVLHDPRHIVGHYRASELIVPTSVSGAAAISVNPIVETLSVLYAWYAPEHVTKIEAAHKSGHLAQSMECVPDQLKCGTCDATHEYKGRAHPSYCACLQQPGSAKHLLGGVFSGGGVIYPPAKPAWASADITEFHAWMERTLEDPQAATVYDQVASEFPHLDKAEWEQIMLEVMAAGEAEIEVAKKYSQEQRMQSARRGHALDDGSYPIEDKEDLKNAITLCRSGHGDVAAAKALIKRRAKQLGAENDWK